MDLDSQSGRKQLIEQIAWTENVKRKAYSLRQTEIYGDYLFNHVWDNITGRFSADTAQAMPICAHINLARRIVKAEASIYKEEPLRSFTDVSDEQYEVLSLIYRDMMANSKFMRSNESFKLQQQNHIMIVPKDGKLQMRVLRNHHVDAIEDPENPEEALGYVIHNFNREFFSGNNRRKENDQYQFGRFNQFTNQRNDSIDAMIGDEDDWKKSENRYLVWTKEFNYIMDGKGNVVSEFTESPIPGTLPIIDISQEKDFTYWVKQGDAIVDATVDYNVTMSDVGFIVQNQGFAQAYMIAEKEMTPDNLQIGPNSLLHLPIDATTDQRPEFGFAQTGADIDGALNYANSKLMAFLTSRGLDPDVISTDSQNSASSSGVQEFLRMMKHFKASKEDYDTYKHAEMKVFEIIKAWQNNVPELLDRKYQTGNLSENAELMVQYAGPEMLQTEQERVDVWASKVENGFASRVDALMALEGIDKDAALERIMEIDENGDFQQGPANNEDFEIGPVRDDSGTEESSEE